MVGSCESYLVEAVKFVVWDCTFPNIRNNSMIWADRYKESETEQNKTRQTQWKAQPTKSKTKKNDRKPNPPTNKQTQTKQYTNHWQSLCFKQNWAFCTVALPTPSLLRRWATRTKAFHTSASRGSSNAKKRCSLWISAGSAAFLSSGAVHSANVKEHFAQGVPLASQTNLQYCACGARAYFRLLLTKRVVPHGKMATPFHENRVHHWMPCLFHVWPNITGSTWKTEICTRRSQRPNHNHW